jgi:hypothetical protein
MDIIVFRMISNHRDVTGIHSIKLVSFHPGNSSSSTPGGGLSIISYRQQHLAGFIF